MPLLPSARRPRGPLALLLTVAALPWAGCGAPAAVDVAASQPVAVSMSEFRLEPQEIALGGGAGRRTFEISNDGRMVHRFELRSEDGSRRIVIGAPLKPGQSETLTVRLARGRYTMRCAQERHNTLGEWGTIRVD